MEHSRILVECNCKVSRENNKVETPERREESEVHETKERAEAKHKESLTLHSHSNPVQ